MNGIAHRMRRLHRYSPCLCITWAMIACLLLAPYASAQSSTAPSTLGDKKPSDVRMVIDISGSMKKNDPQNLRRPALDMLVKLLPKDSKAGVWTFGQYVNMLIPHRPVDDQWVQQAGASANAIKSIAQFTNIGEALEKAAYDAKSSKQDFQKHIILLTDGMVDINRNPQINQQERQRILNDILPMYQKAGFTLHTIALSDNADKQLMSKLALGTDGKAAVANTAEELMNAFLQVFNQAVPAEELPFDGESFVTDSSIEEFTALIFREPNSPATTLIAPDEVKYTKDTNNSRIVWHHTEKYDLVTIKQPLEGEWRVIADVSPESQITVVSDLSLAVKSMPTNISMNDVINTSLALREENQIVSRVEFLRLLDIDVSITNDKGKSWSQSLSDDSAPNKGVYSVILDEFNEEGQYTLTFSVDGKTFKRQFSHNVSVRQPFAIEIDKQEAGVSDNSNTHTTFVVQVIPQLQTLNNDKVEVVGKLKKPSGTSHIVTFSATEDGNWAFTLNPDEKGKYTLAIRVTAMTDSGDTFDFTPPAFTLLNQVDDSVFNTPVEADIELPSPETKKEVEAVTAPEEAKKTIEKVKETVKEAVDYTQWILYGALGLVNILIIALAYIIYRKLANKPQDVTEEEDSASEVKQIEEDIAPAPAMDAPAMDEIMADDVSEPESDNFDLDIMSDDDEDLLTTPEPTDSPPEPESEPEPEPPSDDIANADNTEDMIAEMAAIEASELDAVNVDAEALMDDSIEELMASNSIMNNDDADGIDLGDPEMKDEALAEMLEDEAGEDEMPDFSLDDFGPEGLDDDASTTDVESDPEEKA